MQLHHHLSRVDIGSVVMNTQRKPERKTRRVRDNIDQREGKAFGARENEPLWHCDADFVLGRTRPRRATAGRRALRRR